MFASRCQFGCFHVFSQWPSGFAFFFSLIRNTYSGNIKISLFHTFLKPVCTFFLLLSQCFYSYSFFFVLNLVFFPPIYNTLMLLLSLNNWLLFLAYIFLKTLQLLCKNKYQQFCHIYVQCDEHPLLDNKISHYQINCSKYFS